MGCIESMASEVPCVCMCHRLAQNSAPVHRLKCLPTLRLQGRPAGPTRAAVRRPRQARPARECGCGNRDTERREPSSALPGTDTDENSGAGSCPAWSGGGRATACSLTRKRPAASAPYPARSKPRFASWTRTRGNCTQICQDRRRASVCAPGRRRDRPRQHSRARPCMRAQGRTRARPSRTWVPPRCEAARQRSKRRASCSASPLNANRRSQGPRSPSSLTTRQGRENARGCTQSVPGARTTSRRQLQNAKTRSACPWARLPPSGPVPQGSRAATRARPRTIPTPTSDRGRRLPPQRLAGWRPGGRWGCR